MAETSPNCIYCERGNNQVPILTLLYKGEQVYICVQHLPILIHEPEKLVAHLPGSDELKTVWFQDQE